MKCLIPPVISRNSQPFNRRGILFELSSPLLDGHFCYQGFCFFSCLRSVHIFSSPPLYVAVKNPILCQISFSFFAQNSLIQILPYFSVSVFNFSIFTQKILYEKNAFHSLRTGCYLFYLLSFSPLFCRHALQYVTDVTSQITDGITMARIPVSKNMCRISATNVRIGAHFITV